MTPPIIMPPLFTIGYEHTTPGVFLGELARAKVGLVIDVRAVAASRRPGFSKRQLAAALAERGIGYLHLRALGTPKEGRLAARSGDVGTAGGQFGCQVQLGSWVIGGEWDWNWAGLAEDSTWSTPLIPLIDMTEDQWGPRDYWTHKELDWFSTARVRLGLAWDRVLVFATGGLAYGAFDAYTHVRRYPDGFYNGAYSERRFGWTVGGGLEWAFANKAEFLYLNFDNFDYISPGNIDIAPQYQWRTKIDAEEYVARIGINYLFPHRWRGCAVLIDPLIFSQAVKKPGPT